MEFCHGESEVMALALQRGERNNIALLMPSDLFDSHDDRDDDGEGESVEEHKSVIMHLLSQVRLGMDLTKVKTSEQHMFFVCDSVPFPCGQFF